MTLNLKQLYFTWDCVLIVKHRKGAVLSGKFKLEKGSVLHIAVGQKGEYCGSGSGGTFVIKQASDNSLTPLVIAGGAGGDRNSTRKCWCHAQPNEYGNGPSANSNRNIGSSGSGDNGGAGFYLDGANIQSDLSKCFKNGITGGELSGQKYSILQMKSDSIFEFTFFCFC